MCGTAGIEILWVSRWMGHAIINTTDSIYRQVFHGSRDDDMDRLYAAAQRRATMAPLCAVDL